MLNLCGNSNVFSHQNQTFEKVDETGYITCKKFRTICLYNTLRSEYRVASYTYRVASSVATHSQLRGYA